MDYEELKKEETLDEIVIAFSLVDQRVISVSMHPPRVLSDFYNLFRGGADIVETPFGIYDKTQDVSYVFSLPVLPKDVNRSDIPKNIKKMMKEKVPVRELTYTRKSDTFPRHDITYGDY